MTLRRPVLTTLLLALATTVLLAGARLASNADSPPPAPAAPVPAAEAVGKLTLADVSGTTDYATTVRSFSMAGNQSGASGTGGGGGAGVFTASDGTAGFDTSGPSPLLLRTLATGRHVPTATVVVYAPGTNTRSEQWTFTDVLLADLQYARSSRGKAPRATLQWTYHRVTWTTYAANGSTVVQTYCYDTATRTNC